MMKIRVLATAVLTASAVIAIMAGNQVGASDFESERYNDVEKIYTNVEQPATFPGGIGALVEWLSENLQYPERAQKNDIQGRVTVQFVVSADGSIGDVTVLKGIDEDLDNEAIRVVKSMPKWEPGKVDGQAVKTYFRLPLSFRLPDEQKDSSD